MIRKLSQWAVCVLIAATVIGCSTAGSSSVERRSVQPADFAGQPATPATAAADPSDDAAPVARVASTEGAAGTTGDAPSPGSPTPADNTGADPAKPAVADAAAPAEPNDASPTIPADPTRAITVDAMIGQVNGRALYANKVLDPLEPALTQLGKTVPRFQFRDQAEKLIDGHLRALVQQELILGEADRDLTEQEQLGLKYAMKKHREELVNEYGLGSDKLAEDNILRKTGKTLEQNVEQERQKIVVQRYLRKKLFPKINITRKDIERYWRDHQDQFNPPPSRTLRVIQVNTTTAADQVDAMLKEGKTFIEVASSPVNQRRADKGGLMEPVTGKVVFGGALDEAMEKLDKGQHSPRIEVGGRFWWIYVDDIVRGQTVTYREAQPKIEETLRAQRFSILTARYREDVFINGNFEPIDKMRSALLEVATTRWAGPN